MPLSNARYTVPLNTRVKIATADNMPQQVIIHEADHDASVAVYLGDSTVDATNGFHLHNQETLQLTLRPGDELYAWSAQGSPTMQVIQIQNND